MSVKIVVDSTADLIDEVKERVTIVPLTITFSNEEFIDGITIDKKTFYEKLIESDTLPTTSQATPNAFLQTIDPIVREGNEIVLLTVSSKLSGTYQSAMIAASEYEGSVFVVDTESVAIGAGILTEYALQLADQGLSASEIASKLSEERSNVRIIAMLDTLEYLKKGGRISSTVAFAGGLLAIKPVVCLDRGEIKILGKARGSKQGNNLLVKEIETAGGVDFSKPVLLGYTGLSDFLLQKYIDDSYHLWKNSPSGLRETRIGSVIGTHVGPGAIAAAFFKKG
ncbi:MAG: DegV family protein [Clostridia bacterium]|nr:DegV family protein [Clostridia bacterium]